MSEYLSLAHMKIASPRDREEARCYLPHHAVFRRGHPSKIREVFNASPKGRNGLSLNVLLLAGPKLQSEIAICMTNCRFHTFVFTADIIKMFRQILIHQHLLWQESRDTPVVDLQAVIVTYGTASAPFLAARTLLQLALHGASKYMSKQQIC